MFSNTLLSTLMYFIAFKRMLQDSTEGTYILYMFYHILLPFTFLKYYVNYDDAIEITSLLSMNSTNKSKHVIRNQKRVSGIIKTYKL